MPCLTFAMDPSLSLLASPWPVDRIWRAHQDGGEPAEPVDLGTGGVCVEVRVAGESVILRTLDAATYAFRDALARGLTLGEAASLALESHPFFDLTRAIQELFENGLFDDFALTTEEGG
jgi:hypothetical protein